jgi:hypothetical protein
LQARSRFRIAVNDYRNRAFRGTAPHDGFADSFGAASHHDNLVSEFQVHVSSMQMQETAVQRIIHASDECSLLETKKRASDATSSGRSSIR